MVCVPSMAHWDEKQKLAKNKREDRSTYLGPTSVVHVTTLI